MRLRAEVTNTASTANDLFPLHNFDEASVFTVRATILRASIADRVANRIQISYRIPALELLLNSPESGRNRTQTIGSLFPLSFAATTCSMRTCHGAKHRLLQLALVPRRQPIRATGATDTAFGLTPK